MKLREALIAAGTATALLAGSGCSQELSEQDISCATYVEEGPMSVQAFAKTIHRCIPHLPKELVLDRAGRALTIGMPTRDGGSLYMSAGSNTPRDGDAELFAKGSDSAFIALTNPGSVNPNATIRLGLRPDGNKTFQWESMGPEPREQRVTVGLQSGGTRAIEASPLYHPEQLRLDFKNRALIECVEHEILAQVTQVLKSANTQNDIPKLAPLPLSDRCGEV